MKIKILITFVAIIAIVIIHSCKKDEAVVYHYSFYSVNWDDIVSDSDADNYVTSGILNCLVNLEENVTRKIYANVYYKLISSEEYIFYCSTNLITFDGTSSPLFIQIPIGSAQTELAYGTYDFVVEIFEDGADSPSATTATDITFKATKNFERLADDQVYSVTATWKNDIDLTGDGYVRSSVLYYDVNILNNLEKNVYAEIYIKNVDSSKWKLINTSGEFSIVGNQSNDADSVQIGLQPDELRNGQYNFKILIYEYGSFFPVAAIDNQTSNALNAKKFQTLFDDSYYYNIATNSIIWKSVRDIDGDSYLDSAVLEFDVNVDKQATRDVFAKIYVKNHDSTNYNGYDSTNLFRITYNNSSDKQQMVVKSSKIYSVHKLYLDSAFYDFTISIFEKSAKGPGIQVYSTDSTETLLIKQKFERRK